MTTLLTVWRLLDERQQRRLVALQALSVVMALSTVGGLAAVLPFFSALAEPQVITRHPALRFLYEHWHFSTEHGFVTALGVAFAVGVLLSNAINLLGSLAIDRFAFDVGEALHNALFSEYLHRSYGFHANTHSSVLTTNVIHETGRVTTGILRHGLILVTNIVTVLFIVGSMLLLNAAVASVAVLGLGASYLIVYALARGRLRRDGREMSREYAERTKIVGESLGAVKELILLQAQAPFVARFARCGRLISSAVVRTFAISQSPRYVLEGATVCVLVGAALYASGRGDAMGPWIAQLSFMGFAVYRLLPALQQVFLAIVRIRSDRPALDSVAGDLHLARERERLASLGGASAAPAEQSWRGRPRHEIQLCCVSFFPAAGRPAAIENLTLRIPAGAVIGLVGANGSGKTTLVDLLSGLLVPQLGRVEIDGIALNDANRAEWQSTLAYVPQSVFICDCTLSENIALGIPPARIDRERVRAAVRLARLDECVSALPKGYDEPLGERGARLSGGQRQRLGIARALYRDASVLIMDEPTSALDSVAEREIVDMLAARREGRTVVLIAHRLASLRHCDVIYELAEGEIVRSGTYDDMSAAAAPAKGSLRAYVTSGAKAS